MMAVCALLSREIRRFYRQPSRVIGVFGLPLMSWAIMGLGFSDSFQLNGESYLSYFFPGSVLLVVLFTAIFANISVIEDRHSGFLQSVLVSPIRPAWIAASKALGGAALATIQGALLISVYWMFCGFPSLSSMLMAHASVFLMSVALTSLGYLFAWILDSVQGFHAVMNLVLLPLWIVSGALFPPPREGMLRLVIRSNPLSYGLDLFRHYLVLPFLDPAHVEQSLWVLVVATAALLGAAVVATTQSRRPS